MKRKSLYSLLFATFLFGIFVFHPARAEQTPKTVTHPTAKMICAKVEKPVKTFGSGEHLICDAQSLRKLAEPQSEEQGLLPAHYCAFCESGQHGRVQCRDCTSGILGGEGGRVVCGIQNAGCTIEYGSCGEDRNRPYCP